MKHASCNGCGDGRGKRKLVAALSVVLGALALPAHAAVINVNSPADLADANPFDFQCNGFPVFPGLPVLCTLRAAVQTANFLGTNDLINVPAGVYALTIQGNEGGSPNAAVGDFGRPPGERSHDYPGGRDVDDSQWERCIPSARCRAWG